MADRMRPISRLSAMQTLHLRITQLKKMEDYAH